MLGNNQGMQNILKKLSPIHIPVGENPSKKKNIITNMDTTMLTNT